MYLQNKLNLENQISYLPQIVAMDFLFSKLELTKHITRMLMANLFSRGTPHIHILPQFCNSADCQVHSALTSKASSKVNLLIDDT